MDWTWVDPGEFVTAVTATPFAYSPWSGWQVAALDGGDLLRPDPVF